MHSATKSGKTVNGESGLKRVQHRDYGLILRENKVELMEMLRVIVVG